MTDSTEAIFDIPIGRRNWNRATDRRAFGFVDGFSMEVSDVGSVRFYGGIFTSRTKRWGTTNKKEYILTSQFLTFFGLNWNELWLEKYKFGNIHVDGVRLLANSFNSKEEELFAKRHTLGPPLAEVVNEGTTASASRVLLVRNGDRMYVFFSGIDYPFIFPVGVVLRTMEEVCDYVAIRAGRDIENFDNEVLAGIAAWNNRKLRLDAVYLISIYTGIENRAIIETIKSEFNPRSYRDFANNDSLILAAARMNPQSNSENNLAIILSYIQRTPRIDSEELDLLSDNAMLVLRKVKNLAPYSQGRTLARWLRGEFRCVSGPAYDELLRRLHRLKVQVALVKLDNDALEGFAFWGPLNGPAIVVNRYGPRGPFRRRARVTVAHEFCHLLVDRRREMPLVDMIGGIVDDNAEQRAGAFAAEYLLPEEDIKQRFLKSDFSLHEVSGLLSDLMSEYKLSRWVAGFQFMNTFLKPNAKRISKAVRMYIDELTSKPE